MMSTNINNELHPYSRLIKIFSNNNEIEKVLMSYGFKYTKGYSAIDKNTFKVCIDNLGGTYGNIISYEDDIFSIVTEDSYVLRVGNEFIDILLDLGMIYTFISVEIDGSYGFKLISSDSILHRRKFVAILPDESGVELLTALSNLTEISTFIKDIKLGNI